MTYPFYIAHATFGRTRIRWAGDASEKTRIEEFAVNIVKVPGVENAQPRMTTGSIIIEHDEIEWSKLEPQLTDSLALQFTPAPAARSHTGLEVLDQGLDEVAGVLKGMNMDLNSFALLLLIILAITQALRGQVMVSSASFLWYAFSVLSWARGGTDKPLDTARDSENQSAADQDSSE